MGEAALIHYKDQTFCPFWQECTNGECCPRALTKEVQQKADKINLPICMFVGIPFDCFRRKDNET